MSGHTKFSDLNHKASATAIARARMQLHETLTLAEFERFTAPEALSGVLAAEAARTARRPPER